MRYICGKRFKGEGLAGHFNIPAMSVLETNDINRICFNGRAVCATTSETAHDYFAIDEDKNGTGRFILTRKIRKLLEGPKDKIHLKRWDLVMDDSICQKYEKKELKDHWLWSDEFYKAPLPDLEYILNLIKEG